MSTQVTYKGNTIANFTNDTKTLKTAGKYMEDNVTITEVIAGQGNVWQDEDGYVHLDDESGLDFQAKSVNPTESSQTVRPDAGYTALSQVTVGAISSTYVGTGIARKSSTDLTAAGSTVTVPIGYYSTQATKNISGGQAFTPAVTITTNPTFSFVSSTGKLTAAYTGSSNITPTVTAGYIAAGTSGQVTTTGTSTYTLPSLAATTYNTSTADQTITSYRWLKGNQTIKSVVTSNLIASNIKSGVTIKVGDANNASRITQVTGTYAPTLISKTVTPTEDIQVITAGTFVTTQSGYVTVADGFSYSTINLQVGTEYSIHIIFEDQDTGAGTYDVWYDVIKDTTNYIVAGKPLGYSDVYISNTYAWVESNAGNPHGYLTFTIYEKGEAEGLSQVTVNPIPAGGFTVDDIAMRTISGAITGNAATSIGKYAFAYCPNLTTASFPNATTIGDAAFYYCSNLTTVNFPSVTTIGGNAFNSCKSLTTVSFPSATSIGNYAFTYCSNLTTASFPNATSIGYSAFAYCPNLTTLSFPSATFIGGYAFNRCSSLTTVNFPNATTISSYAFYSCYRLLSLYLLGSSMCIISGTSPFYVTPISSYTTYTSGVYGSIFVPASLYNSYISAANWSTYSSRFVSLTDAEINNVLNYGRHDP